MYTTVPEFSAAFVIESIKLIIMMCGIFNFEIRKGKRSILTSVGVAVLLTAAFTAIPAYFELDLSKMNDDAYKTELLRTNPFKLIIFLFFSINAVTLPVTVISSVLHFLEGKKKFLIALICYMTVCCIDELIHYSVCRLFNNEYNEYYLLTTSLTIIILALPAYLIQSKKMKGLDYPLRKMNAFYLIVLVAAQVIVYIYAVDYHAELGVKKSLLTLTIVLIFTAECIVVYSVNRRDYYYNLSHINQKMLDVQENYYMKLLDHQDELRKFRHDLNNHIISVEALLNEEKYDEVRKYIGQIKGVYSSSNPEVKTGNTVVSAIASDYKTKFPEVSLEWNGLFPDELAVSNTDICTMFSNVLGNAFENADKCQKEKTVSATIETVTNSMIVTVKNTASEAVTIKNGKFVTSKNDKHNHGIGTQNIKRCVEKNNGMVEYRFDDNVFEVKIILPNALKVF
ncbi:ATP-binding protein [Ruminococcus sp. HUN007]|uniref:sensor histidine kinase n=1 Tax=Ruminococcus sp. HUN007 TaxID=1514668 RepID=UPI0005D17FBC|nr:ATP-binding protein [Ruminococcus sp. HUN007]